MTSTATLTTHPATPAQDLLPLSELERRLEAYLLIARRIGTCPR